jgi:indolepyruvate ferredoxin oxidoreductase beta subunit
MSASLSNDQPIAIAIMALGGQGGGVMQSWLVTLAEQQGWIAQSTSVPGVAQRTGATVYYVEMIGKAAKRPVLSLMPIPGMVDVVVAAEWMEAGRAIQRGFVTPDRTCLIASTHRQFSVAEKTVPGDGSMDPQVVRVAADASAKKVFAADMAALAEENGSVISASMFGAIAASRALPFPREAFEEAIRSQGVGVNASLKAFAAGYDAVSPAAAKPLEMTASSAAVYTSERRMSGGTAEQQAAFAALQKRIERDLPPVAHDMAQTGLARVVDFQDTAYGEEYLARLQRIHTLDQQNGGEARNFTATQEAAKYIAAAMTYRDVIRVADLKIRASRFDRIRKDVKASDEQIVAMTEFLHPRVEEIAEMLPRKMARRIENSRFISGLIDKLFAGGKRVRTDSLRGFAMLYMLSGLRRMRMRSMRHYRESNHIDAWMRMTVDILPQDYDLATEVIRCRRLIKGYSDTHARGMSKYDKVMQGVMKLRGRPDAAEWTERLRRLALKDIDGKELDGALKTIASFESSPAR